MHHFIRVCWFPLAKHRFVVNSFWTILHHQITSLNSFARQLMYYSNFTCLACMYFYSFDWLRTIKWMHVILNRIIDHLSPAQYKAWLFLIRTLNYFESLLQVVQFNSIKMFGKRLGFQEYFWGAWLLVFLTASTIGKIKNNKIYNELTSSKTKLEMIKYKSPNSTYSCSGMPSRCGTRWLPPWHRPLWSPLSWKRLHSMRCWSSWQKHTHLFLSQKLWIQDGGGACEHRSRIPCTAPTFHNKYTFWWRHQWSHRRSWFPIWLQTQN